jgi:predicted nucleic acid-binding protein
MVYLVDTGVLLRIFNPTDPNCAAIRKMLWRLRKAGHEFAVSPQNVAEFWSVSTRPATYGRFHWRRFYELGNWCSN